MITSRLLKLSSVRPSSRSINFLLLISGGGLFVGLLRIFSSPDSEEVLSVASFGMLLAISAYVIFAIYDWLAGIPREELTFQRILPNSFSLNKNQAVRIDIQNDSNHDLDVELYDAIPDSMVSSQFPLKQTIFASTTGCFEYTVTPHERGLSTFEESYALIKSKYGLWQYVERLGDRQDVKVYPDFTAISDSFLLGIERAMRNLGAHIAKHKGDGTEFNQLREFREGDTLKQIDWKATARVGEPITREYQEEKDQNIIFLLDCSRRMRAKDDNLSYFDHALNALLMTSYLALDKGDAVGVLSFSGEPSWLPPLKGKLGVNTILNHLYDLATSTFSSDYIDAAEDLLIKHRKRSLVILMTNIRDEDDQDLCKAVDLLRQQHLVMVVAVQERVLENVDNIDLSSNEGAKLYAGVKHFESQRGRVLAKLKARGVSIVDANHSNMHILLANEYLRLKQSGRL